MKNIINYALYLLLAPVLLICFSSCQNEAIVEVQDQQPNVTIEYNEESKTRSTGINYLDLVEIGEVPDFKKVGPNPDCIHGDCDTAVPAMSAFLQQLANELCKEVWGEIACCTDDDQVLFYMMYALPHSPPCPKLADH